MALEILKSNFPFKSMSLLCSFLENLDNEVFFDKSNSPAEYLPPTPISLTGFASKNLI